MTEEIAIVGASAAGLHTAGLLARAGRQVRVYEATSRLEPAPRTLIVTHQYRDVLGAVGNGAVVNEVRHYELFTDGRVASVTLARPDLVIERAVLIRALAREAEAAGASIRLGHRLREVDWAPHGAEVRFDRPGGRSTSVRVSTLVGADGAFGRVGRLAGWRPPATVSLAQAVVRLPQGLPRDTTRVWFIPEETPYFYWLIPDSASTGVLGLIGEHGAETRRCLTRFLERQHLSPLAFQAARIPLYSPSMARPRRVGGAEVYLVGDAATHVKVTTVGGIVTGFRGARGVAEAILYGRRRELRQLHRELLVHLLLRRLLHVFTPADYSRLLDLLDGASRRCLGVHTRDEAEQLLVRLCRHQPRLLLLALPKLVAACRQVRVHVSAR